MIDKKIIVMANAMEEMEDLLSKRMEAADKLRTAALRYNNAMKADKKRADIGQFRKDQWQRDLALYQAAMEVSGIGNSIKTVYGEDLGLSNKKTALAEMSAEEHFEICSTFYKMWIAAKEYLKAAQKQ